MQLLYWLTLFLIPFLCNAQSTDYRDELLGYYNVRVVERTWDVTVNNGSPNFDTIQTQILVTTFQGDSSMVNSIEDRLTVRLNPSVSELDSSICGNTVFPISISPNFLIPVVDSIGQLVYPEFETCNNQSFFGQISGDSIQLDYESYTQWGGWRKIITGSRSPTNLDAPSYKSEIKVYPNPSSSSFKLETARTGGLIIITNNTGQLVLIKSITSKITPFNLSGFPEGVYFLGVLDDTRYSTLKIIKI